ncbi:autoinducer binding domain-containing protein [Paracoccus laeviglucosivorans]|uniref:autoinducer binding domain-containing protein n=1 Tax=Paracoccus laeviglucosivorans TaxID=1197861 RepID=UPI0011580B52
MDLSIDHGRHPQQPGQMNQLNRRKSRRSGGYFIGLRIRARGADKIFNTYPCKWRLRYRRMSYLLRDPTLAWGYTHTGVIHWDELPVSIPEESSPTGSRSYLSPACIATKHAIRLIAEGRTSAIAAHELGISITALHARLTSARKRLGADRISDLVHAARSRSLS